MSTPTVSTYRPQKAVIGDGTTGVSRFKERIKRWRALIITVLCIFAVGVISSLIRPTGNTVPLHPHNSEANGGMALAQILQDRGVSVHTTNSISSAVNRADTDTTVLVYDAYFLDATNFDDILAAGANLVVIEPTFSTLQQLGLDLQLESQPTGTDMQELVDAHCEDPHAQPARSIPIGIQGISDAPGSDAQICFTSDAEGPGAYAVAKDGRARFFAQPHPLMNQNLTTGGHAALTIRSLGAKEKVVWVIPSHTESQSDDSVTMLDFMPPWFSTVIVLGVFVFVYLAFWRGRRLGRLVTEPLPVEVRAAESTIGLGHIYRRGNELGHAAQALRSGTMLRCANRLGVSPTADGTAIASAIAHAVDRPYEEISQLLLGPPPSSENNLIVLTQMLDRLESEVNAS